MSRTSGEFVSLSALSLRVCVGRTFFVHIILRRNLRKKIASSRTRFKLFTIESISL